MRTNLKKKKSQNPPLPCPRVVQLLIAVACLNNQRQADFPLLTSVRDICIKYPQIPDQEGNFFFPLSNWRDFPFGALPTELTSWLKIFFSLETANNVNPDTGVGKGLDAEAWGLGLRT